MYVHMLLTLDCMFERNLSKPCKKSGKTTPSVGEQAGGKTESARCSVQVWG
jgi:hypothetical protein